MSQKIIKLEEALEFAKENCYLFAVYGKRDDGYHLIEDTYEDDDIVDVDSQINIIVKTTGEGMGLQIHFNEFTTVDKQYYFILHNNYNISKIIPIL